MFITKAAAEESYFMCCVHKAGCTHIQVVYSHLFSALQHCHEYIPSDVLLAGVIYILAVSTCVY